MDIEEILEGNHQGNLYNLLLLHSQRLNLKKDDGAIYDLAHDIINFPKRYKQLINKLKKYEQTKNS